MRMNKKTLHYGGWGVVNTQPLAWTSHFNPRNRKFIGGRDGDFQLLNGDSHGDRRLARVNEMRALLNTAVRPTMMDAAFDRR